MLNRKQSNRWLLLYLLYLMGSCEHHEIRLQAMVFEIQKAIREKGSTQTFNYSFIRWVVGAYSRELQEDIEFFIQKELISKKCFVLSEKAQAYIESTKPLLNRFFFFQDDFFAMKVEELKSIEIQTLLRQSYVKHELNSQKIGKTIQHVLYDMDAINFR